MKKLMPVVVSALTLALGAPLAWSADQQPQQQPAATPTIPEAQGTNVPASGAASVQSPPANWTQLSGMVQTVDKAAKTVQIKDDTGAVLQVPVDRQVNIQKEGKQVKFSQISAGDSITLVKKPSTTQPGSGTY